MKISDTAILVGIGVIGFEFYRRGKVLNGLVKIALFAISDTAAVIGIGVIGFEFYRRGKVLDGLVKITLIHCRKTSVKCLVSLVMDILYSDESMEVIVDSFRRNVVILLQVIQHRLLENYRNHNNILVLIEFNEASARTNEYALLSYDTVKGVDRLARVFNELFHVPFFSEDNPSILAGRTVACEKECHARIGRKVNEVRFTSVVL